MISATKCKECPNCKGDKAFLFHRTSKEKMMMDLSCADCNLLFTFEVTNCSGKYPEAFTKYAKSMVRFAATHLSTPESE